MGQHSSKRRSYTPGQDANSEIPSNTLANGDVKYDASANGGLDAHHKAPTSLTPVEQQPPAGKKDKRKKIRIIGITLRRTSSGRWTRKRRSMRANGSTRPVSCPVNSLSTEDKGKQPRPQSLFEEEVIHEDDGKIETVDLSDHEDSSQAKTSEGATAAVADAEPVPKPRDKKWKRNSSDKKQSKKKKEKKNSKKDKSKKKSKAPDVPVMESEKNKNPSDTTGAESAPATAVDSQEEATDINEVASSIVHQSINIARDRLIAEQEAAGDGDVVQTEDIDSADSAMKPVEDAVATPVSIAHVESSPMAQIDSLPEVEEEMIIPTTAPVKETVPILPQMGQADEADDKEDLTNQKPEQAIDVQVEVVQPETDTPSSQITTETVEVVESSLPDANLVVEVADDIEEVVEEAIVQEKVEKIKTLPFTPSLPSNDNENAPDESETVKEMDAEENKMTQESQTKPSEVEEKVKNDESGATASNEIVEENNENKDAVADIEAEKAAAAKLAKEQKEKEKQDRERIKKQKEEEKAKEKERHKEEKRKKAEQKALEKEKLRDKSDNKSPLSKRLSDFFKRDKTLKTTDGAHVNADVPAEASSDKNLESSTDLESPNSGLTDSQPDTSSCPNTSINKSLTVDVSVQPLPNLATNGQPDDSVSPSSPTDSTSPDSAPISPVSVDISNEPVTPTSEDGEKGESTGVLKKILLGPRLRTAILRKKSSSASDSGSEDKRVSLTQPKGVETAEVTAPPRKLRPRKPVDQYSPVTVGAHNPLRHPSPRLEHTKNDSVDASVNLDTSQEEPLPKEEESLSKEIFDSINNKSKNVMSEVDCAAQSSTDIASLETEPKTEVILVTDEAPVECSQDHIVSEESHPENKSMEDIHVPEETPTECSEAQAVSVEPQSENISTEDAHNTEKNPIECSEILKMSLEPQSEIITPVNITEDILEASQTLDVPSEPSLQEVLEASHTLDVSSEPSLQEVLVASHSLDVSSEPSLQEGLDTLPSENEKVEAIESPCDEVKSEVNGNDNEEKSPLSGDNVAKVELTEENLEEDADITKTVESPTLVSKASIVLRSVSTEGNRDVTQVIETSSSLENEVQMEAPSSMSTESFEHEISSPVFANESNTESHDDSVDKDNNGDDNAPNMFSEITSSSQKDEDDGSEDTSTHYTVVCTVQSENSDNETSEGKGSNDEGGSRITITVKGSMSSCLDIGEIASYSPVYSRDIENGSLQDVASDSSDHGAETSPTLSSTDQWESHQLDIHLDDSAIEMDKESPTADTQSPALSDSSVKPEDEGVNSDNSSDNCNEDHEINGDNNKADSTATIEAYLKLQHADVKDLSIKNHVDHGLQVLKNETENGVGSDEDTTALQETSTTS